MRHCCLRCGREITEAEVKYQDGYCADCYMIVMGDVDEDEEESEKARERECLHMPNMYLSQGGYWHNY